MPPFDFENMLGYMTLNIMTIIYSSRFTVSLWENCSLLGVDENARGQFLAKWRLSFFCMCVIMVWFYSGYKYCVKRIQLYIVKQC